MPTNRSQSCWRRVAASWISSASSRCSSAVSGDICGAMRNLVYHGGRKLPAAVAVLAVVIVFHDPGAAAAGPVEESHATRQRHGDAERILMRGRDVSHA